MRNSITVLIRSVSQSHCSPAPIKLLPHKHTVKCYTITILLASLYVSAWPKGFAYFFEFLLHLDVVVREIVNRNTWMSIV